MTTVWLNGSLVPEEQARLSPFDHGVLVGDGVFETMKVVGGLAFAMGRHLARLRRSGAALALAIPDDEVLRSAVEAVVGANRAVGRVRITVTGGAGPLGSGRGDGPPTVVVAAGPPSTWEATAAVAVVPWARNERGAVAGVKTISYAENVVALRWAQEHGAEEALFADTTGRLCEGTGSNVFVGVSGRLLTPSLDCGCLAGVTRELLLELGHGEEADVPIGALADADEAFLASSTRDVQPVRVIDGRVLPTCPGPLTQKAALAFAALLADDLDP
jgi:branched-chain amino acid aminotransferase